MSERIIATGRTNGVDWRLYEEALDGRRVRLVSFDGSGSGGAVVVLNGFGGSLEGAFLAVADALREDLGHG